MVDYKLTSNLALKQGALGYNPVQQGTGINQSNNVVKIGWTGSRLAATVDVTNLGNIVFDSHLSSYIKGMQTDTIYGTKNPLITIDGTNYPLVRTTGTHKVYALEMISSGDQWYFQGMCRVNGSNYRWILPVELKSDV